MGKVVKEEFFKIARWFIIRCIQKSEEIFKHSACGTGGWNEFHNGMAFVDIAIPCGNIFFPIFWSDDLDSSFRTCCRIELKEGKSCNETVHLLIEFFNRNAFTLQL